MKALKISLVVIVIVAIGAGVFFWIQSTEDPKKVKVSENQFTRKIEQEIEQLKAKPDGMFCKDFYKEVSYHINDYYRKNKFGNNQSENDQWKENLESNLYSAYSEKFIKQSKTVFRGSVWNPEDLKFIQSEKNELKISRLLVPGSAVDNDFLSIQTTLNKYNEIKSFISSCRGYGYSSTDLSARFPIADVQNKILRATSLSNSHMENEYVNNCTLLHEDLKEIPSALFRKHVWYLDNKIDYWSNMWCNYISHKDYSQNLNTTLRNEINDLGNSTFYNGVDVNSQYDRLSEKWKTDNRSAFNATYPCK